MARALIFAGGSGRRMNSGSKPKQFLEMHGKPIIIYTLEHFEYHEEISDIIVVCIREWIEELQGLLRRYGITKVTKIVPGGATGHDSIYNGLQAMKEEADFNEVVLIHDGVRPLINAELISQNIEAVKRYGNAITAEPVRESVVKSVDGINISDVPPRSHMYIAKAPQSFYFGDILKLYDMAYNDKLKTIDSSHLCSKYQVPMHIIISTKNNLKITEPADFYIYRALYEALESQQVFGL
ncbi:MAG: 2-C-methyl-D-erythritol 4-phosphate cytidylyltransferase [Clostridiales bacterium]|nr:IspD/TarI family cytidylyltransferase [uncultured Lachnoclostridium sp.]MBS5629159.1 2-C-methyl-D-erythritol 4-phosphate cytidylyltransferase [Clostridiales bacterium]MBS6852140.1 2-C-methyl-D-erythritol 4-phosphate cytidylyltransferase [Clostridiales bacterium]